PLVYRARALDCQTRLLMRPLRRLRKFVSLCNSKFAGESGEIGRRTRLRIWRREAWGFESPLSHQKLNSPFLISTRPPACDPHCALTGSKASIAVLTGSVD